MQFFEKNELLSHETIISRFPYLSNILSVNHSLDIDSNLVSDVEFDVEGQRIKLRSPYSNSVWTNVEGELDYHTKFFFKNSLHKQPLAKALGIKKGQTAPNVLDVTAGMLSDTLLIYSLGCKVSAVERNPAAYILARNTIEISQIDIKLDFLDASEVIAGQDVIYFDPMYEDTNKKALPKKEMRIFREVVGVDSDANIVANKLKVLCKRLVIKRSIKGTPLLDNPDMSFVGKSTAYDVYLNHA
jgi:16S rRNA (guanine1516-N2)-methyltransferase